MSDDIDYDALLATWDGMSPHDDGIELCRVGNDMYDAIRALRYALHDAEAGELKNALAVGQVCIELNEERRANEALRAAAVESERDAARYRFQHDNCLTFSPSRRLWELRDAAFLVVATGTAYTYEQAVDAAMAAQEKAQQQKEGE